MSDMLNTVWRIRIIDPYLSTLGTRVCNDKYKPNDNIDRDDKTNRLPRYDDTCAKACKHRVIVDSAMDSERSLFVEIELRRKGYEQYFGLPISYGNKMFSATLHIAHRRTPMLLKRAIESRSSRLESASS